MEMETYEKPRMEIVDVDSIAILTSGCEPGTPDENEGPMGDDF